MVKKETVIMVEIKVVAAVEMVETVWVEMQTVTVVEIKNSGTGCGHGSSNQT